MIDLSNNRIEQILHEESPKKEELATILRSIYTRYMRLYESYFADIDALNDEKIAAWKAYDEETLSLVKYYYMDIPMDICIGIKEFNNKYSRNLLGADWHTFLFDSYEDFKKKNGDETVREESSKAAFAKQALSDFYDAMDYIFRDGFGTGSKTAENAVSWISGLLFGKKEK